MKLARLPDGSPEIFRTLQGEGPSIGCPAVFLRLSLCNLHCVWCDTPFTWNWEGSPWPHQDKRKYSKEEHLLTLSCEEIAPILEQTASTGDRLVITGGEPLLQQEEIVTLLQNLPKSFSAVEVETNGTQLPSPSLDTLITQYNVSPKLSNSLNSEELRLPEAPLEFFADSPKAFFKFVILADQDLAEVHHLATRFGIPAHRILLMPEGRTREALDKNRARVAEACLAGGFRLTDRLHVQLWGDQRGR